MTKTFAYFIHELLESFSHEKIEIALHQSASEVNYKECHIYQKLLAQVCESGKLPYIYDIYKTYLP